MYITLQAFVHRGLRPSKVRYSPCPIAVPDVLSQRSSISVLRPRGSWHNSMVSEVQAPISSAIRKVILCQSSAGQNPKGKNITIFPGKLTQNPIQIPACSSEARSAIIWNGIRLSCSPPEDFPEDCTISAKSPARKAVKSIKQSSCAALVPILFRESLLRRRGSVAAQNSTPKHPAGNILTI